MMVVVVAVVVVVMVMVMVLVLAVAVAVVVVVVAVVAAVVLVVYVWRIIQLSIMTNFLMLKIGFTKGPDRLAGHLGNHKLISKQPLGWVDPFLGYTMKPAGLAGFMDPESHCSTP